MRCISHFVRGLSLTFLLAKATLASSTPISPELYDSTEPVSVSVTPSYVSNVPANTHTPTVGPDNKPTLVPIVGGAECWVSASNPSYASSLESDHFNPSFARTMVKPTIPKVDGLYWALKAQELTTHPLPSSSTLSRLSRSCRMGIQRIPRPGRSTTLLQKSSETISRLQPEKPSALGSQCCRKPRQM